MSDALTPAELADQQAELLPGRTVLSMLTVSSTGANGENGSNSTGTPTINVLDVPLTIPHVGG